MSSKLYEWQKQALQQFVDKKKLLIQAATGTGKSYLAMQCINHIIKESPHTRILIVAPKINILEHTWLPHLYQNGFGPFDVGIYYSAGKEYGKVVLTTNASITNIPLELFDAIIADEVHNMMTPRLLDVLQRNWTYKLGLSATITSTTERHWYVHKAFEYNEYTYTPKQAIDEGIISKLEFHTIPVMFEDTTTKTEYESIDSEIKRLSIMYASAKWSDPIRAGKIKASLFAAVTKRNNLVFNYQPKLQQVINIVEKHKNNKIIIFNERNDVSRKLQWMLLDTGVKTFVVNSNVKKEEQRQRLIKFGKTQGGILLASRSLDEGFNVPSCDIGIMLSGGSTTRQLIQRTGRVIRKSEGKEKAVVYQLYLDGTFEQKDAIKREEFFKEIASNV